MLVAAGVKGLIHVPAHIKAGNCFKFLMVFNFLQGSKMDSFPSSPAGINLFLQPVFLEHLLHAGPDYNLAKQ